MTVSETGTHINNDDDDFNLTNKGKDQENESTADKRLPRRKALVIAVSEYNHKEKLGQLEFCKNDGEQIYEILKSLQFEISDDHKLIGYVKYNEMRDAIFDFFSNNDTLADDLLLFYFTGHGIPISGENMCFASSEMDPDSPRRRGFPSSELTDLIQENNSIRIVEILDCCHSGANTLPTRVNRGTDEWLAMGPDDAAEKLGKDAIEKNAQSLKNQGEGRYLLGASQAIQRAYGSTEKGHSIFTFYLLEGLRGNKDSIDTKGNVTPYTLGNYIYKEIVNLPGKKKPKQKPVMKVDASGDIILASYPSFIQKKIDVSKKEYEATSYFNDGEYVKVVKICDEVLDNDHKNIIALAYKGKALFRQEKFKEAIVFFDEVLSINPSDVLILKEKGISLAKLSEDSKAIKYFDKVLEIDPSDSKTLYFKGLSLSNLSENSQAIECFDYVLKLNPNFTEALRAKGAVLENIAKELPKYPVGKDISTILYKGIQYLENENYENAIKLFNEGISLDPNSSILYNYKGDALLKLEKYEEAIKSYDEALKINPEYFDVLKDKGRVYDALGSFDKAIDCYDKAIKIRPKNAQIWFFKGLALYRLTKYDEAISCFDESLRIDIKMDDAKKYKELALGLKQKKDVTSSFGLSYENSAKTETTIKDDGKPSLISKKIKSKLVSEIYTTADSKTPIFDKSWEVVEKPRSIALDSKGFVCVTADKIESLEKKKFLIKKDYDYLYYSYVYKFDSDGNFLAKWGTYGSGDGQFKNPEGITVDSKDHVYVADRNNSRIQIWK